jgi:hypothetical protein
MYDHVAKIDNSFGYRDQNDFLATYYPTAIMARYNAMKAKGLLPEPKIGKEVAYDFDGTVSTGIRPHKGGTIITGRTEKEIPGAKRLMKKAGMPSVPVVNFPKEHIGSQSDIKKEIGMFKAKEINRRGVETFYENDPVQQEIIRKKTKATVIEVNNQ